MDLLRKKRESQRVLTCLGDVSFLLTGREKHLSQLLLREATIRVLLQDLSYPQLAHLEGSFVGACL